MPKYRIKSGSISGRTDGIIELSEVHAKKLMSVSEDRGRMELELIEEINTEPVVQPEPIQPEPIQLPPVIEPEPVPEPTPDGPTIPVETIVEVQPPIMTTTTTFSPRRGRR